MPQLSEAAEVTVGSIIRTGSNRIDFSRLNVAADAGTWIFEVIALDDEPEPWQEESDPKEVFIVVDADPEAHITQVGGSVPIGSLTGSLTLSSADSFDPDSPCEREPLRCHLTHDGSGARRISRPITGRNWVVLEGALDDGTYHPTGPIQEVFGIRNGTDELSFPMAGLPPGLWTFELTVEDGEGNTDSITHMVEVVNENSRPLVFLSPPARYLISPFGIVDTPIGFKGGLSFDPDNILTGELPGISSYNWNLLSNGIGCTDLPPDLHLPDYELYRSGSLIHPLCQGVWEVELTIEDDDIPKQNNSASSVLTIGTCEGTVCIDFPTESLRKIVDFADNTDVLIFYHVDALALADPRFDFGMYARLDIYHQSDLSTSIFSSFNPNVVTHQISPILVFHWDGNWEFGPPRPGKYSIKLSLLDYSRTQADPLFKDFERDAIHIEVDELSITTDSDVYANVDQLNKGSDTLSIGYEIEGRVMPDRVEWRLLDETNDIVYRQDLTPALRGRINWDGQVRPETLIGTGNYSVEVEAFLHGASLTGITSHEVILYRLRFETVANSPDLAVMVNNDDDNLNGRADMDEGVALVSDENDLLEVNLVFEPAVEGHLEVFSNDTPQKIKLYANANRGGGSLAMPLTYNLPVDTVPPIFIEATQVGVADLRLLFTPTEHAVLEDSVLEVKNIGIEISNWERAPTLSVDIAHLDHAYTETAAAIPRNSRVNNFIDDEIDRFHIGVDAPNLNADSARRETFTVNISTALDDGSEDDNPTPITVRESSRAGARDVDSGFFLSEPQILVTQDIQNSSDSRADDNFRAHDGITAARNDDALNDRTHRATIDGAVKVTLTQDAIELDHTIPICQRNPEQRRIVRINVTIFKDPDTGVGYASSNYVYEQVRRAKIAWSPACIKFEIYNINTVDAPTFEFQGMDFNIFSDQVLNDPDDTDIIIENYAPHASINTLELFVVPSIVRPTIVRPSENDFFVSVLAFTRPPIVDLDALGLNTFVFIMNRLPISNRTLAHEMGHALTNGLDVDCQPLPIFFPNKPGPGCESTYNPDDSPFNRFRRFDRMTEFDARTDRAEAHSTPGDTSSPPPRPQAPGNYLLRMP